jgi:hypothetical protein
MQEAKWRPADQPRRAMGPDMLTILKTLGIIVVVVFLVVVFGLRWLFRKLRGVVEENLPVPCRIHPEPEARDL